MRQGNPTIVNPATVTAEPCKACNSRPEANHSASNSGQFQSSWFPRTITTSQGTKGKLGVVEFADPQQARREGNNLWSGSNPAAATNTQVVQGSIEHSNVSGVTEMANLIRVQRAYEQLASIMSRQDDLRTTAVQKLGAAA